MEPLNGSAASREPWNKGKLTRQKPPLEPPEIWVIRTRLKMSSNIRELSQFNRAIAYGISKSASSSTNIEPILRLKGTCVNKADSGRRASAAPPTKTTYLTADERSAKGRALRDAVPRGSHAGWETPEGRRDPVELLSESNEGRMPELIPIRFGRMSASPFAFYRGAAALMAADLAATPTSGIRVQACGDAHLMNFGGFATPERNVIFDINDLDETLPAPFEWDLKRLAASVVIAAQHLELPNSDAARIVIDLVREYRERMQNYSGMRALDVWYDRIDLQSMKTGRAILPSWQQCASGWQSEWKWKGGSRSQTIYIRSSYPKMADYPGSRTSPR
jgi:hypothetical protein